MTITSAVLETCMGRLPAQVGPEALAAFVVGCELQCRLGIMLITYPRTLIHSKPATGLQGNTSLQYCVAATLVDGRSSLASFTGQALRRPEIAQGWTKRPRDKPGRTKAG